MKCKLHGMDSHVNICFIKNASKQEWYFCFESLHSSSVVLSLWCLTTTEQWKGQKTHGVFSAAQKEDKQVRIDAAGVIYIYTEVDRSVLLAMFNIMHQISVFLQDCVSKNTLLISYIIIHPKSSTELVFLLVF